MKKKIFLGLIIGTMVLSLTGCSSCQRARKSLRSDIDGGLNRTITVYDYSGNVLRQYNGKFDVQQSESRVYFDDQNGKRVIIYNAIVVNEEN